MEAEVLSFESWFTFKNCAKISWLTFTKDYAASIKREKLIYFLFYG